MNRLAFLLSAAVAAWLGEGAALAFGNPIAPVESTLSVQATTPLATDPGGTPAVFTFSRTGATNSAVTFSFSITGTASNGVDYNTISNVLTLAAGQTTANLLVTPIAETSAKGFKSIVINLRARGLEPAQPVAVRVGFLDRATAYIEYNYTNIVPAVKVLTPTNGAAFLSLPNIELSAAASDSNGWVASVQFFANGHALGVISNNPFGGGIYNPLLLREVHGVMTPIWAGNRASRFQWMWTNVPAGAYALTAVAVDNAGLQTTSAPVDIVVTTNLPTPTVHIASPARGAVFPENIPINIYAAAGEPGGVINTVEFLANGVVLKIATNYLACEPYSEFNLRAPQLPYHFRWTNAPAGTNVLTVTATDNNGTRVTSAPLEINVSAHPVFHHPAR